MHQLDLHIRAIFESVQVSKAQVEISILGDDPLTGNPKDIVLLKMNADRETFSNMNLDKVEPSKLLNFKNTKFKPPKVDDKLFLTLKLNHQLILKI